MVEQAGHPFTGTDPAHARALTRRKQHTPSLAQTPRTQGHRPGKCSPHLDRHRPRPQPPSPAHPSATPATALQPPSPAPQSQTRNSLAPLNPIRKPCALEPQPPHQATSATHHRELPHAPDSSSNRRAVSKAQTKQTRFDARAPEWRGCPLPQTFKHWLDHMGRLSTSTNRIATHTST